MTVELRRAPYAGWRALAATVLVMCGAVGAHTAAGGRVPDGAALVALGGLVLGGSLLLTHGVLSARWLLPVLALAQVGLHTAFSGVPAAGQHAHHGDHLWTWQMLLAHTVVTALTAVVWRLSDRAAIVLLGALPTVALPVEPRPAPLPAATAPRTLAQLFHVTVAPRRGPPVLPRPA